MAAGVILVTLDKLARPFSAQILVPCTVIASTEPATAILGMEERIAAQVVVKMIAMVKTESV